MKCNAPQRMNLIKLQCYVHSTCSLSCLTYICSIVIERHKLTPILLLFACFYLSYVQGKEWRKVGNRK